jgi:hypothetical protein
MSRLARLLLAFALSGCYIAPSSPSGPPSTGQPCTDSDGDHYCADTDCNDQDGKVYPGAPDAPGDGLDQNCDGYDG